MGKTVCKDCTTRHVGCHAECPEYLAFFHEREASRKKHAHDHEAKGFIVRSVIRSKRARRTKR